MNSEQLAKATEIRKFIEKIDELLIRMEKENRPQIRFDNSGNGYNHIDKHMYETIISPSELAIVEHLAGDYVIKALKAKRSRLEQEFQNL